MEHEELWDALASTRKLIAKRRTESREDHALLSDESRELREAINDLIAADRAIHDRIVKVQKQLDALETDHALLNHQHLTLANDHAVLTSDLLITHRRVEDIATDHDRVTANTLSADNDIQHLQAENEALKADNERLQALNDDHHSHNAHLHQELQKGWKADYYDICR